MTQSAESRFEALPGFLRVRRYDTVDYVRSGLKVAEEKSERADVGSIIEVAGEWGPDSRVETIP